MRKVNSWSLLLIVFFSFLASSALVAQDDDEDIRVKNEINSTFTSFSKYQIFDLGTLTTDESEAVAINERGQVLGLFSEGGETFALLWDTENGLKIIELPIKFGSSNLMKLNNNGQIAGTYYSNSVHRSFIWSEERGLVDMGSLGGNHVDIQEFNDKGQAVGISYTKENKAHVFYYANDEMVDLTNIFCECIPGEWIRLSADAINNQGNVIINAMKKLDGTNRYITKAYLWKDGIFKMILPEKSFDTSVHVHDIDDRGNMIVGIVPLEKEGKCYFISPFEGITARLSNYSSESRCDWVIRNNLPLKRDCLPGKLKKDSNGDLYFSPGLLISKILVEEEPFYDVGNTRTTRIYGQNSNGYVVGRINTLYPGFHAFVAIPEKDGVE